MKNRMLLSIVLAASFSTSCMTLDYDLASVPVPVSAKAAQPGAGSSEPFTIEANHILWVHGLFGGSQPDVAALVARRAQGSQGVTGFRVRQESGFGHWLLTHLSLTLVRMKKVVIEGSLVR